VSEVRNSAVRYEGGWHLTDRKRESKPGKPLITVITATFDDAAELQKTANAMRSLNYRNVEWIIVDGGSSDSTLEVIRRNEDLVAYWLSESDRGIYDAWNKGVSHAHGEWISFLGAGDGYRPTALDEYMAEIERQEFVPHLISSKVRHVSDSYKTLRVWGEKFEWRKFRKFMNIGHCGALHHKSLFNQYGVFDISFTSASDYEFLMRCRAGLKAAYVDSVTTDMPVGGVSNGYKGLVETYRIQRKYGEGKVAMLWLAIACIKRFVRPTLRGY
jgi:glycosyltransferase involved in cell wall biosynthesis